MSEKPPGHVFVSYVHEDSARVDVLCDHLRLAGIRVWRDVDDLWPGDDWRQRIRGAITGTSFAFVACFSTASEARDRTYQREELILAAEEMRLRRPGRPWLFPVRFDNVELPSYDLGPGRNLNTLQRIDLFADDAPMIVRLVSAVTLILADQKGNATPEAAPAPKPTTGSPDTSVRARMRSLLRDPREELQLEDFVMDTVSEVREALGDAGAFPSRFADTAQIESAKEAAEVAERYLETTRPVVEILVNGCGSGTPSHNGLWAQVVTNLLPRRDRDGHVGLVNLQRIPGLVAVFAAAIAAVQKGNWGALKAVTVDAKARNDQGERVPAIELAHPYLAFDHGRLTTEILAVNAMTDVPMTDEAMQSRLARGGWRHTPVEDWLYAKLRPAFAAQILDADDFTDVFTRTELFLGLIATDLNLVRPAGAPYLHGANVGSFTWRDRHHGSEQGLLAEIQEADEEWPPLTVGLFGGRSDRAIAASESFNDYVRQIRPSRWG
jgi:hypothetical protein